MRHSQRVLLGLWLGTGLSQAALAQPTADGGPGGTTDVVQADPAPDASAGAAPAKAHTPLAVVPALPASAPGPAAAETPLPGRSLDDLSLEDLLATPVTVASRLAESALTAPTNLTVVTDTQIREWGVRDLKDVLRRVVGYQVIYDRDEWVFASRGNVADNNAKYLILIDGHRMNSAENFGPGQVIELPNDLSNVKRIEIVRGPGSVVWGPDALAGVINICTKDYADLKERSHASVTYGQDKTVKANFQVGQSVLGIAEVVIMGAFVRSDGRKITVDASTKLPVLDTTTGYSTAPFGRFTTYLDRYRDSYMLQMKATAGAFSLNSYVLKAGFFNRQFETPGIAGRVNYHTSDKYFVQGAWSRYVPGDIEVTARIAHGYFKAEYLPTTGTSLYQFWTDRDLTYSLDLQRFFLEKKLSLALGLDYRYIDIGPSVKLQPYSAEAPLTGTTGQLLDRRLLDHNYGAYLLGRYTPHPMVTLHAGIRMDYNNDRGSTPLVMNPRLALVSQPRSGTVLKLVYNSGFLRPANFQAGGTTPVSSERMQQFDLIWTQGLGPLNFTVDGYWQKLSGFIFIVATGGALSQFTNAGDYVAKGIELSLSANLGSHSLWANGGYGRSNGQNFPVGLAADNRRVTPDGRLLNYPTATGNLGGTARFLQGKLFISPALRVVGPIDYRIAPASTTVDDATYAKTSTMAYVDCNIGYDFARSVTLNVFGTNLFDMRKPVPMSIWNGTVDQYGRYIEAKLSVRF